MRTYDVGLIENFGGRTTSLFTYVNSYRGEIGSTGWEGPKRGIVVDGIVIWTGTLSLLTPLCLKEWVGTSNWDLQITHIGSAESKKEVRSSTSNDPSQNLTQIQKVFHLSITELAKLFGVSRQAIYDWRAGKGVSSEHTEKLSALAKAATILVDTSVPISQLLRRKLAGGKTLFEIVKDGGSAELAALKLLDLAKRDIEQRQRLESRLGARKRPSVARGDIGLPMLSEEA